MKPHQMLHSNFIQMEQSDGEAKPIKEKLIDICRMRCSLVDQTICCILKRIQIEKEENKYDFLITKENYFLLNKIGAIVSTLKGLL